MAELVLRNCDVLQVEGGRPLILAGQDIFITGARIRSIEPSGPAGGAGLQVIDAAGMLAIPGLINTHAHVPMVLFRGMAEDVSFEAWFNDYIWPLESNLTPEDVYWGALLGLAEMIEAGITCVADHYFEMDQVARAVEQSGLRANLTWAIFGHEGQEKIDRTSRFIQDWNGKADGRIAAWLGPHAPYTTSPDFLRACAKRAEELGVGIHTHVSEVAGQVEQSLKEHGVTPVRLLADCGVLDVPAILAHCLYPTDEDIQVMAGKPAGVAHAPKTYMKLGMGTVHLQRFLDAGVPVGLATDGVVSSNTLDILEQLRLMALLQKHEAGDPTHFTVGQALEIAFQGSARVLGWQDQIGRLQPGYYADIALLRQDGAHVTPRVDPAAGLVYSARSSDVDTVICHGRVLMQGRRLLTLNKEEIRREVTARLQRLSQRVPGKRIATYSQNV